MFTLKEKTFAFVNQQLKIIRYYCSKCGSKKKDASEINRTDYKPIANPLQTYAETIIIHQYDLKYCWFMIV